MYVRPNGQSKIYKTDLALGIVFAAVTVVVLLVK